MQVTVKTLQHQLFKVEVNGTDTIKKLKEVIETNKGKETFPTNCQKLIYAGKILEDDKTINDYKIDESKFIVAMVSKPKTKLQADTVSEASVRRTSSNSTTELYHQVLEDESLSTIMPSSTTVSSETIPVSTSDTSQSTLDEWANFEEALTTALSNGDTDIPEHALPLLPDCNPPSFPSMEEILPEIQRDVAACVNLEELSEGNNDPLHNLTRERVNSLRNDVEAAGGIDAYLESAIANQDRPFADVLAVMALRDTARHMDMSIENTLSMLSQENISLASANSSFDLHRPSTSRDGSSNITNSSLSNERLEAASLGVLPESGVADQAASLETSHLQPAGEFDENNHVPHIDSHPSLQNVADSLSDNSEERGSYMEQVGQEDPDLLDFIRNRPEEFINLFNDPDAAEPSAPYVRFTSQERADIHQLKALGFSEEACIQAYVACDKNVQMAASLLFSEDM